MDEISTQQHVEWLSFVTIIAEILTAGAVLRFSGRVFFGLGKNESPATKDAPRIDMDFETKGSHTRTPAFMWVPMAALLVGAAVLAFPLRGAADRYASQFETARIYQGAVLQNTSPVVEVPTRFHTSLLATSTFTWWTRIVVFIGVLLLAGADLMLKHRKAKPPLPFTVLPAALSVVRGFQSGRIGDYIAWFAFGMAAYGGILIFLR
jgi:NADH:ubiquinone oxidoreductase subunit 5 (subunit L)/multisubunit Na+/H+ antiporter MnhA subunit